GHAQEVRQSATSTRSVSGAHRTFCTSVWRSSRAVIADQTSVRGWTVPRYVWTTDGKISPMRPDCGVCSVPMTEPIVMMKDVNKHFGDLHVLRDINLEVGHGEVVI